MNLRAVATLPVAVEKPPDVVATVTDDAAALEELDEEVAAALELTLEEELELLDEELEEELEELLEEELELTLEELELLAEELDEVWLEDVADEFAADELFADDWATDELTELLFAELLELLGSDEEPPPPPQAVRINPVSNAAASVFCCLLIAISLMSRMGIS